MRLAENDLNLHLDRAKGAKAQALLNNEVLQEAFRVLEEGYIEEWKTNERRLGPEGREALWQAVQVVGKVQAHLERLIADGQLAAAELDNLHPSKSG